MGAKSLPPHCQSVTSGQLSLRPTDTTDRLHSTIFVHHLYSWGVWVGGGTDMLMVCTLGSQVSFQLVYGIFSALQVLLQA